MRFPESNNKENYLLLGGHIKTPICSTEKEKLRLGLPAANRYFEVFGKSLWIRGIAAVRVRACGKENLR